MRIALGIEYDGSHYRGWQVQQHDPCTVQAAVERALSKVADHPVAIVCGGRTDAGVHASGQVVHFDTTAERPMRGWMFGTNANMPGDVVVRWAQPVADDFHARFAALRRAYRYVILNRNVRPALQSRHVSFDYRELDAARMAEAAQHLIGEHDFSSYRAVACQARSPVRHVQRLEVKRQGEFITLDIEANGFLHHMVRNIAGVLMAIGAGERPVAWSREVLEARDRNVGGVTASPYGLYLVRIDYPEEFGIPCLPPPALVW